MQKDKRSWIINKWYCVTGFPRSSIHCLQITRTCILKTVFLHDSCAYLCNQMSCLKLHPTTKYNQNLQCQQSVQVANKHSFNQLHSYQVIFFFQLSYSLKVTLSPDGDVLNSHCECPVGTGPHGTCKHVAALLFKLVEIVAANGLGQTNSSCTDQLQTFHRPSRKYTGMG